MTFTEKEIEAQEECIPELAKKATQEAYHRALQAGITVTVVEAGRIVQFTQTADGIKKTETGKRTQPRRRVLTRRFRIL